MYGLLQIFLFIFFLVFLSRASKKNGSVFICILSMILMLSFFSSDFVDQVQHLNDPSEREREAFSVTQDMKQSFASDPNKCAMLSSISSDVRRTLCNDSDIKKACTDHCDESCLESMPDPRQEPYQIVITDSYTPS